MCFAGSMSREPGPVERVDHLAIRAEDAVQRLVGGGLRRAGWVPRVVAHVGYGLEGAWVRVLGRVVLVPEDSLAARHPEDARGWRRFVTQSAAGVPVTIEVGGVRTRVESDREGYLDVRLPADLPPGWATARLSRDAARGRMTSKHAPSPKALLSVILWPSEAQIRSTTASPSPRP